MRGLLESGISRRRSCALTGIGRSSFEYEAHPRYGHRRAWALLRRSGVKVNLKRVLRLWRKAGFTLQRRRSRKRLYGKRFPGPLVALYPRHVVTYDFVQDWTVDGRRLRILTIVDEFTREALAIAVGRRMTAWDVIGVLAKAFAKWGWPQYLRSDNGPEFIARILQEWLHARGVKSFYIAPGSPWQNAYGESFNDKLRAECLDLERFEAPKEAQGTLGRWLRHYNQERPHSSLGYLTPSEYAEQWRRRKEGL